MPTPDNSPSTFLIAFGPGYHVEAYEAGPAPGFTIGIDGRSINLMPDPCGKLTRSAWKILRSFGSYKRPFEWRDATWLLSTSEDWRVPSFSLFEGPAGTFLMACFPGHKSLWFDATKLGSPLEQAIWALETRFPDRICQC